MNAVERILVNESPTHWIFEKWVFSIRIFGVVLLIIAILASALTIVYVKATQRDLCSELQVFQQAHDNLRTEWGQLLLEKNTWSAPVRVQTRAQEDLKMIVPTSKNIVVVSLVNK